MSDREIVHYLTDHILLVLKTADKTPEQADALIGDLMQSLGQRTAELLKPE